MIAAARRHLRRLGLDVVRHPVAGSLWATLDGVFRRTNVTCVIDVGAHRGEYARFLRAHGYTGTIVSFEPVPSSAMFAAAHSAKDPRWHVHQLGLGATTETRAITVAKASNLSSFLSPSAVGRERFGEGMAPAMTVEVDVRRLDDVFAAASAEASPGSAFLKCDTQGFDLQVIAGAEAVLDRFAGVQLELDLKPLYEGAATFEDGVAVLAERGFVLAGMWPVARTPAGAMLQAEAVFVREVGVRPKAAR